MGRLRRSRTHKGIKDISKKYRTRRRTKDLDQIQEDLKPENRERLARREEDPDLPGLGMHYCVECSKHFINDQSLKEHKRGKLHKRRIKLLKEPAYTLEEAEQAGGLTTDNGKGRSQPNIASSLLQKKKENDMRKESMALEQNPTTMLN
ncbi:hypothetical protein H4219_001506 [Mycoemilia scoparia]|uniref:C2H2-type domain-containing protein n=1 Tax=Mycoemilia scoparia TaxID=417184 RepID=A0A9W8DVZ1_9FUNG|nr:hypothetical protein H4219_001506 [Mycoemilia scoparia]